MSADVVRTAVPCECVGTCEVAVVVDFGMWKDEPREVWVEFGTTTHVRLRRRLAKAWAVLLGKDPWFHGICLHDGDGIEKLIAALKGNQP